MKVADGSDSYKINLYLNARTSSGTVVPITKADLVGPSPKYKVRVLFKWEDTLKRQQAVEETATGDLAYTKADANLRYHNKPFKNATNGGVLYKPVVLTSGTSTPALPSESGITLSSDKYTEDLILKTWQTPTATSGQLVFDVKSVAPTSSDNTSRIEKTTTATGTTTGTARVVSNEDFSLLEETIGAPVFEDTSGNKIELEPNALRLRSIDWRIDRYEGGVAVGQDFGEWAVSGNNGEPIPLRFKPALSVETLSGPGTNGANTLWLYRNVPDAITVQGKDARTYGGAVPIDPNDPVTPPTVKIHLKESNERVFVTGFTKNPTQKLGIWEYVGGDAVLISKGINSTFSEITEAKLPQIISTLSDATDATLPSNYARGSAIYTTVTYVPNGGSVGINADTQDQNGNIIRAKTVTYFSNHLPRVPSAASNPAAVIKGATYSQGADTRSVQSGINTNGVGDLNVNIVRDFLYEKITKLLRGKTNPERNENPVTIKTISKDSCKTSDGCLYVDLSDERSGRSEEIFVYNVPDLILRDTSDGTVSWSTTNKVIIVQDGSIHIESDLKSTDSTKLGLIAYNTQENEEPLETAHLYIGPDVKSINANMFVDSSLFSSENFSDGPTYNQYGEPQIDASLYQTTFNKQLVIKGSLSSRNCIGCVDSATNYYYTPRGPLKPMNDENKNISKKYDLNYLRYFSLGIIFNDEGYPIDLQCMKALTGEEEDGDCSSSIDATKTYEKGGDLAVLDKDSATESELIDGSEEVIDGGIYTTTKTNPLYIEFGHVYEKSFIFSQEKSLTF